MILTRYGTGFLQFGFGDKVLGIEVKRPTGQRPLVALASFVPLPVPSQQNSVARLIVYRNLALDETNPSLTTLFAGSTASGDTWDALLGSGEVLYDAWFPYGMQPCVARFDAWPNEKCVSQDNQVLGAAILQPSDQTTGALINGIVNLTFQGIDAPSDDESAVRAWKVK